MDSEWILGLGVKGTQFGSLLNKQTNNISKLVCQIFGKGLNSVYTKKIYFRIIHIILTAFWNLDNWLSLEHKLMRNEGTDKVLVTHWGGGGSRKISNSSSDTYWARHQPGVHEPPPQIKEKAQVLKLSMEGKGAEKASEWYRWGSASALLWTQETGPLSPAYKPPRSPIVLRVTSWNVPHNLTPTELSNRSLYLQSIIQTCDLDL